MIHFICWGCLTIMGYGAQRDEDGNFWCGPCWKYEQFCRRHPGVN